MRITGRQLRQIIKEEVESMMSEVDATSADMVKKFTDTLQAGIAPGSIVSRQIIGSETKVNSQGEMVRYPTRWPLILGRLAPLFEKAGAGSGRPLNVNMVVDVSDNGRILKINAIAVNGMKPEAGLPFVIDDGEKAVTADIMSTVTWFSPQSFLSRDPNKAEIKSIKFRV